MTKNNQQSIANNQRLTKDEFLHSIADELRTIAAFGLNFAKDSYTVERYEGVLAASAKLTAVITHQSPDELLAQYQQTHFAVGPMASGEAVVMRDGKMLLIQRHDDGLWALPGGITDAGETVAETAVRELWEETAVCGHAVQLLGIFDSRIWQSEKKIHFYHAVFLVEAENSEVVGNVEEVTAVDFFDENNLPPLSPGHHLRVPHIFKQLRGDAPIPFFDT